MDQLGKATWGQTEDIAVPISSSTCHYYRVTCSNKEQRLSMKAALAKVNRPAMRIEQNIDLTQICRRASIL